MSYFSPNLDTPTYRSPEQEFDYHLQRVLTRDSYLNQEEQRVYNDTAVELEWGEGFLRRAHP